jgi:phosphatidylglycerophosphatase A
MIPIILKGTNLFWEAIRTTLGSGLVPKAPGTWGSALSLFLFVVWIENSIPPLTVWGILLVTLFVAGTYSVLRRKKQFKPTHRHGFDEQTTVIDETIGQGIALIPVIDSVSHGALDPSERFTLYFLSFVFFRIFDIWKPWPIKVLDEWSHRDPRLSFPLPAPVQASMVLFDDVLAGICAAVVLVVGMRMTMIML